MASGIASDLCPDLRELEKKIGRKTPESLLVSMRDLAVDRDEGLISDLDERADPHATHNDKDSFSDKIKHLKGEMRRLRRADAQILWQLVAVHEGLEALRWLEEERGGTPASGGSSLTGSQSSLSTITEGGCCWPSLPPSRTSPVPACSQDSTPGCSPTSEEPAGVLPSPDCDADGVSNHKGQSFPKHNLWSDEVGSTLGPLGPECEVRDLKWSSGHNNRTQALNTGPDPNPGNSVCTETLQKPHSRVSSLSPTTTPRDYRKNAQTIRKALDRSIQKRLKVGSGGSLAPTNQKGEMKTQGGVAKERVQRNGEKQVAEDEGSALSAEKALFAYDARWFWVESQDDVTFL